MSARPKQSSSFVTPREKQIAVAWCSSCRKPPSRADWRTAVERCEAASSHLRPPRIWKSGQASTYKLQLGQTNYRNLHQAAVQDHKLISPRYGALQHTASEARGSLKALLPSFLFTTSRDTAARKQPHLMSVIQLSSRSYLRLLPQPPGGRTLRPYVQLSQAPSQSGFPDQLFIPAPLCPFAHHHLCARLGAE